MGDQRRMLLILRLSSRSSVHCWTVARRVALAGMICGFILEDSRDDRLAIGLRARTQAVDPIDAQGPESFDLEREFDDPEGCR